MAGKREITRLDVEGPGNCDETTHLGVLMEEHLRRVLDSRLLVDHAHGQAAHLALDLTPWAMRGRAERGRGRVTNVPYLLYSW